MTAPPEERAAFAERLRVQLTARYRDIEATADADQFALRVRASGLDVTLPLAPLHHACLRQPERTGSLIADFVRQAETRLLGGGARAVVSAARLLWCVRTRRYLSSLGGAPRLLTREVGGELVGFAAELLPGSVMQGVPREAWEAAGLDGAAVREAAERNTAERFARLTARISGAPRVPRDGWSLSGDVLFQASVLCVPAILEALAARAGGEVLLAAPERSVVLAIPAAAEGARRFRERVLRTYRESLDPLTQEVLVTEGRTLRSERRAREPRRLDLFAWLRG